jgi:16S rRNA (guanine527-N7)-methyltransferase
LRWRAIGSNAASSNAGVTQPDADELEALLGAAGVEPRLAGPPARYGALVLDANRRFNLTGSKTTAEFAPHLLDSLTVVPYLSAPYVDVGSGGGLPAIPAAIAAGMAITMIESTAKKARFLEATLERLGVRGEVLAERAEVAGHDERLRERFASGTARAVGSASTVGELLLPLIAPGGLAVLQRGGRDDDRSALEDAALVLGGAVEREIALEGGRSIVLVRKTRATPPRFPRRSGVPAKRPLCE